MKVLMLGWELPPHNSGGMGKACYELCKSLAKQKVDIDFILPYKTDHQIDFMTVKSAVPINVEELKRLGGVYDTQRYFVSGIQQIGVSLSDHQLAYERAVVDMSERRTFDIVHAHDWLTFRAAMRLKEKHGCPIILHVHSLESDRAGGNPGNPLIREIEETAFGLADRIIAVSDHNKQAIVRDYEIDPDLIEVVHNSLDIGDLEPLDPENAYHYLSSMKSLGYRVVTNVGRLTIQKNLTTLLKAIKKVVDKVPKTLVLIVGTGEQETELMELAAGLGVGANVLFADFQRGKSLRDAFAVGDLSVLPSSSEPFGLVSLESVAYGTPALISKQSGVSEVINNVLKVDSWDVDEMANQIASVMMSDDLRDELASSSYEELQAMSWEESSQKVIDIYGQHLAGATA